MSALLGSGFYASGTADFDRKYEFFHDIWRPRLGDRDIVVIDNSECPTPKLVGLSIPNVRVIPVLKNAGHVGSFVGQHRPHILGWSLSWIQTALMAYAEGRDFVYFEQDALAFGPWEESILKDMESRQLDMAFGEGSKWAATEQSIFYIRRDFITEAIWMYLSIPEGDGLILPEDKFRIMAERNFRVGRFSMGCGRNRPINYEAEAWYSQKFTDEEMAQLREKKLI